MSNKIERLIDLIQRAVLSGPASSQAQLRRTVAERAAAPPGEGPEVPSTMSGYVDKVAHAAYKIIDEDIEAMRQAGLDDDNIYEVTISAALSAGLERYRRGIAALREESS